MYEPTKKQTWKERTIELISLLTCSCYVKSSEKRKPALPARFVFNLLSVIMPVVSCELEVIFTGQPIKHQKMNTIQEKRKINAKLYISKDGLIEYVTASKQALQPSEIQGLSEANIHWDGSVAKLYISNIQTDNETDEIVLRVNGVYKTII